MEGSENSRETFSSVAVWKLRSNEISVPATIGGRTLHQCQIGTCRELEGEHRKRGGEVKNENENENEDVVLLCFDSDLRRSVCLPTHLLHEIV